MKSHECALKLIDLWITSLLFDVNYEVIFLIFEGTPSLAIPGRGFICEKPHRKLISHACSWHGCQPKAPKSFWSPPPPPLLNYTRQKLKLAVSKRSARVFKGPLPTFMHCTPPTQVSEISCYTKLPRIVVKGFSKDLISVRSGYPLEKIVIRSKGSGNCHPFERLGLSVWRKLSSVRTARAILSKQLSASLVFRNTFTRAVCDEVSKNVSLNNSYKRCLPSPHEFSRYILYWIAFFAFITFDYRYNFYQDYKGIIFDKYPEQVVFWLLCAKYQTLLVAVGILIMYHHLPSPFPGKQLKSYYQGTDLKNKNCSLHIHGGLHVTNLNASVYFVTQLPRHVTETFTFLSVKPKMSMDSSTSIRNNTYLQASQANSETQRRCAHSWIALTILSSCEKECRPIIARIYKSAISKQKQTTALHQGRQLALKGLSAGLKRVMSTGLFTVCKL